MRHSRNRMSLLGRAFVRRGVLLALAAIPTAVDAQIRGQPITAPRQGWWFSGGAAGVVLGDIVDGRSRTRWRFGNDPLWQFRGTLEKGLARGGTLGVSAGYGVVDVNVTPLATPPTRPGIEPLCSGSCDAELELWSAMLQFRNGDGPGFHSIFEAQGGVTGFRNLRLRATRQTLTDDASWDLSGTLGFGFGYTVSPGTAVTLVQDFGIGWHSAQDLPSGTGRTWRVRTTRAALRFRF